jgi:hypothetical protein
MIAYWNGWTKLNDDYGKARHVPSLGPYLLLGKWPLRSRSATWACNTSIR